MKKDIYLIFSGEELIQLLTIDEKTAIKYKKELVKYALIIDKRVGQGNSNRIYVLKPDAYSGVSGHRFRNYPDSCSGNIRTPCQLIKFYSNKLLFSMNLFLFSIITNPLYSFQP